MIRKLGFVIVLVMTSILSLQAATVSGVVKEGDSTGVIVPNAIVTLSTGGGGQSLLDTTDATGAFSFTGIAAGNRQLRASKTGYQTSTQTAVAITDSAAGIYVKDLYLVSNSLRATIAGTVTDTISALPLKGVMVVIRRTGTVRDTVLTDTAGVFKFDTIAGGTYTLKITKAGYTAKNPSVTVSSATVPAVIVQLAQILHATVTGTVTDTVSTLPLKDAMVVLRVGNVRDTVITDSTGVFKFDSLVSGTYTLNITKTGYTAKSSSVTVSSATVPAVVVQLYQVQYATISGTVTDSVSTTALNVARVILQAGTRRDTVLTGATGLFSFDSVRSGAYTLTTSLTGYIPKSITGTVSSATVPAISILLAPIQYASISGTITDSTTAAAVSGAKVKLRTSGGGAGTVIDSAVTIADGKFVFAKVESGRSYTINVTITGYVARTTAAITLTGTTAAIADIKILAIVMAKITGKVTSDSLKGPIVPGATVILSLRGTAGGSGTPIDTMTSDSTGAFLFENVASGSNYRVTASLTGFTSAYSGITGKTAGIDTANIAMVKIGTGSLLVRILKRADSTALPGATVTAIATGSSTTLSGVSGADGSTVFTGFEIATTLNFAVTASAAGYTAVAGNGTVAKNAVDTVTIYLTAATTGTKLLKGVISDSTSKAPLSNVRVVLTISSGGGGGGTTLTFIDTTGADGSYAFGGLPVNRNTGTLVATLTGYPNFNRNNAAIGAANVADTVTLNIVLLKTTAVGPGAISAIVLHPEFKLFSTGILQLNNFVNFGMVKIFSIDGKLLFKSAFNPQTKLIRLPTSLVVSGKALLVSVSQNSAIYRKQIIIP